MNKYETPKYYVFIDIDGVLTSSRIECANSHPFGLWSKFDPNAIEFFNRLHDTYVGVQFVLISTWRNYVSSKISTKLWIASAFHNAGFRGKFDWDENWKVNLDDDHKLHGQRRAYEIKDFLENVISGDYKDYIIFDDNDYNFQGVLGKKRLVKTSPEDGLLYKHMKNALSLTGTWEKK